MPPSTSSRFELTTCTIDHFINLYSMSCLHPRLSQGFDEYFLFRCTHMCVHASSVDLWLWLWISRGCMTAYWPQLSDGWVHQTRSISLQNDIPPRSSHCCISWMILTPQQSGALRACPHPAPPCLLCLWFLMTKCIETIGWTLPSIRRYSEGSLCGSGPQDFRRLTKQLLLALGWLAAMLFSPTGKRLCESAGLDDWMFTSWHISTTSVKAIGSYVSHILYCRSQKTYPAKQSICVWRIASS